MSLGAVLIRPQPLTAPPSPVGPGDVIIAFGESLMKDPAMTLPALRVMGEEAIQFLTETAAAFEEPMRLGDGKVRALFAPFAGPVGSIVEGLSGDVTSALPAVLDGLVKLLEQLTTARIVDFARNLIDFAEKDLGISGARFRTLLTDLFTRMIVRLQSRVENGDTSDEAMALYDFGVGLDDILILLDRDVAFPQFDTTKLLADIGKAWASFDLDRVIALLRSILQKGEELLGPLAAIAQAVAEVNVSVNAGSGPARPIAAAGGSKNRFMAANGTGDTSTLTVTPPPIAWYASWAAGEQVRYTAEMSQDRTLAGNPLRGFTYKNISWEKMEKIAFHTAWIFPLVESVLFHSTSVEEGDIGNNMMLLLENLGQMGIVAFDKEEIPLWIRWPLAGVSPLIGSLESGLRACWWYHYLADLLENVMYRMWSWEMRELVLSICTLWNDDKQMFQQIVAEQHLTDNFDLLRNADYLQGVCDATVEIGNLFFFGFYRDRGNYYSAVPPGSTRSKPLLDNMWWLPQIWALGMATLGYLIARPLSGEPVFQGRGLARMLLSWGRDGMFGRYSFATTGAGVATGFRLAAAYFSYALQYLVYRFMFTEGDTDGGTLALDTNGANAPGGITFPGYPSPATSPYLLPWAGSYRMCVQGNMGAITHNAINGTGQIYAVDFEMALGEEILASRAGIIVNVGDTQPVGTSNWNYVEIMHLIVILPGQTPPAGVTALAPMPAPSAPPAAVVANFADGTPIPPGTLFPPYWIPPGSPNAGNPIFGFQPPLHPSAAILPAGWTPPAAAPYYKNFNGFPPGTQFAFLLPSHDRGLGSGAAGQVISNGSGGLINLQATFATYGHGQQNFMSKSGIPGAPAIAGAPNQTSIYRSSNPLQVIGQFIQQGQVIMLAGSTGISAFNHLHMQMSGQISAAPGAGTGANWSIPFVFQDLKNDIAHGIFKAIVLRNGVPKVFTSYTPTVTRIAPQ